MIKRHHIRQFLGVADAGSFVQAAARLHITQPSLSAGIAELERLVGTRLFVRNRRLVRLTEAGGTFLPIARDLERGFRAADSFGRGIVPDWPTLRLGTIRTIAAPTLRAVIEPLMGAYGVELIEGSDHDLRGNLASGRIACALTLLRDVEHGLVAYPLWDEPYRMFMPAGHRLAHGGTVAPEDLASEIMIALRACEVLEDTSRFFTSVGVRPRFALRSESDERCMAMVAAGWGSRPRRCRWRLRARWRSMSRAMRSRARSVCCAILRLGRIWRRAVCLSVLRGKHCSCELPGNARKTCTRRPSGVRLDAGPDCGFARYPESHAV